MSHASQRTVCTHSCLHIGSTDPAHPPATRHARCFMGSSSSSTHHPSRPGPCGLAAAGQGCCLQRGDRQSVARGQGLGGLRRPCSPGWGWSGERQLGVWGDRGLTSSRDHPPWIPHIEGAQESPRHPPCRSPAGLSASKPLLTAYRCPLRAAPGASTGQCARGRVPVGSSALGPNTDGDVTSGRSLVLSEPSCFFICGAGGSGCNCRVGLSWKVNGPEPAILTLAVKPFVTTVMSGFDRWVGAQWWGLLMSRKHPTSR